MHWRDLSGARWALQVANDHPRSVPKVWAFRTDVERDEWILKNPARRTAVGKRHPLVKSYRQARETSRK